MTAFLDFLNTFAIWIYIAGVIGVLFGIKMLFDARRAARTTLFTLEQEQASDRAFRAVLVMLAFTIIIAGVASVNQFLTPALPTPSPLIEPTEPSYTPPVILNTETPQPSPTTAPPTRPLQPTSAPTQPPPPATTAAPTQPPARTAAPTEPPPQPTAVPPTAALVYPQLTLNSPPDGDTISAGNVRLRWGSNKNGDLEAPPTLPPDRWYRVAISYTSNSRNQAVTLVYCTHDNGMDRRTGLDIGETRGDSPDGIYKWTVLIVQSSSQQACVTGDFAALSPASATSMFHLP